MIDKKNKYGRVVMLSTVANFELYHRTNPYFPAGIDKIVVDGRNGMYGIDSLLYILKKLEKTSIDWIIMADEDVIFHNSSMVYDIIEKMQTNNYTFSGLRDGGEIAHRKHNPYLINTFFSIINFNKIKGKLNIQKIRSHQFINAKEFDDNLNRLKFEFNELSLNEPYYCFYLYFRRLGHKILFLEANMRKDNIANNVLFNGELVLTHTWFARGYGIIDKHTNRINRYLKEMPIEYDNVSNDYTMYRDYAFGTKLFLKKLGKRIVTKITKNK